MSVTTRAMRRGRARAALLPAVIAALLVAGCTSGSGATATTMPPNAGPGTARGTLTSPTALAPRTTSSTGAPARTDAHPPTMRSSATAATAPDSSSGAPGSSLTRAATAPPRPRDTPATTPVPPPAKPTVKATVKPTVKPTAKPPAKPTTTPPAKPPAERPADRIVTAEILAAVNRYRQRAGVAAVEEGGCADASASIHAKSQAAAGRMYHRTLAQIETACKMIGGENVAYGYATPTAALAGWWASPSHRANILDARYRIMGVAVAYAKDGIPYYTQVFYIP